VIISLITPPGRAVSNREAHASPAPSTTTCRTDRTVPGSNGQPP